MNILYNGGVRLYHIGARIASLRSEKVAKMLKGQKEAYGRIRSALGDGGCDLWIHAASLGEFEQARPLIERLRREQPDRKILLTFFSPSGYDVRCNYPKVDCVAYLPFDTPANVRRFLDAAKPRMAVFVKYEFWGNYLEELSRRDIPVYIISAIFRPSQPFFKPWGGIFRDMLGRFSRLYVQDDNSRELLKGIGIGKVTVNGDTRFDRVSEIMASSFEIPVVRDFMAGAKLAFIAGSSWPEDEERYIPWLNSMADKGVRAIIAPHEFDDRRLQVLLDSFNGDAELLSRVEAGGADALAGKRVIIVDSFGKLSSLYRYGHVAYIGGGFGAGIHNINEAAVYGMPVIFGPKYAKFKEARDLIALGGANSIADAGDFAGLLNTYLSAPELMAESGKIAGDYIRKNIGATDVIYNDLFSSQPDRRND